MEAIEVLLSMDIGGTNCRMGLCSRDGTLYEKEIVSTETMAEEGFADALVRRMRAFLQRAGKAYAVRGIAMGFPATIDKARRVVLQAPAIAGMEHFVVCDLLEGAFGLPVFLEKDVNLLFEYDRKNLHLPDEGLSIGIYFGTGIGTAIFYNGKPFLGANGVAGELGHIPQWKNTRECGCGNIGCLEPFGGGKRLAELCRTTHPDANIRTIYRDCAGDPDVWGQVDAMAIAVATEVNILDPAYVVLGGGLLQMEGFPIPYFEQKIRAYVRKPYPEQNLRLVYFRPDQENGIIGAAFYGWEQLNRQA